MSETYFIKELKPNTFEIAKFSDYKECDATHIVTHKADWHCDCIGYRVQKDKSQHKHCQLAKFWVESLDKLEATALWFDGDDIEYRQLI